jgi:hypothetical protein
MAEGIMPESFKHGDFIRLKNDPTGSVGVVWKIYPEKGESVEVAWLDSPTSRILQRYHPNKLEIALGPIPGYAIALKTSLFLT